MTHPQAQERAGDRFDIASEAAEEVIIALVIVAEFGDTQPTSDGASAARKQHAPEQRREPPGIASMQHAAQVFDPQRHLRNEDFLGHPWLSCTMRL
jgi:hypothetical protein